MSAAVLFEKQAEAEKKVGEFAAQVEGRAALLQGEVKAFYALAAGQRGVAASEPR